MNEKDFALAVKSIGGHPYIVGGWVRDQIMGRDSNDRDYVIVGVCENAFAACFPMAKQVGGNFPVYLVEIDGERREVAFARRERKTCSGYKGFSVVYDATVTIAEDLYRRDLTVNSIARSLPEGALIDPFGGEADISDKILRATSAHFSEDPVRVLRAARLAAQLEFTIEPRTIELMRGCGAELEFEPGERIFMELEKAFAARRPSIFFRSLQSAGVLAIVFPWLSNLIGRIRSASIGEKDAFEHTMIVLDKVSRETERPEVRFAALTYNVGYGSASQEVLSRGNEHQKNGLEILSGINKALRLPRLWKQCAELVIKEHARALCLTEPEDIRDLLVALSKNPLRFDGFNAIIMADRGVLPWYLKEYERYMTVIKKAQSAKIPENLRGMEIGIWRRQTEIQALTGVLASGR